MTAKPRFTALEGATLDQQRGRVMPWLTTVATLQTAFRRLLGDTVPLVDDPLVTDWLSGMYRTAREHEDAVADLFAAFDLTPAAPGMAGLLGTALGRAREIAGQVQGVLAGGRRGAAWRNLRQLQLTNLDALSGFAVVESLGLALGRPRVVEISFAVQGQKTQDQLLLRELFLEFAADAILRPEG
jgi:hypothetical protein